MVALIGSTLVTRAGALVAQVVLGWILTDADFGVYAVALSVALAFQILREAGLRDVLVQEGRDRFDASAGPALWASLAMALVGAAVLLVAAPFLAAGFGRQELGPVVAVLALALPVQALFITSLARLQIDLRFPAIARIEVVSAVVRYGSTIGLALAGAGALSFALPVLLVAFTESLLGWLAVGRPRVARPGGWRPSWALLRRSSWPLFNTLATTLPRQSDYLMLRLVAPYPVVGTYFFAYQLTFQFATVLFTNARKVLLAAFSSRHEEPGWLADALLRASTAFALGASATLLVLVPIADDVEAFLWRGRWVAAVPSIVAFTALLPLALVLLLPDLALQATGRFRLSFLTSLAGNLGIPVVALLAGRSAAAPGDAVRVAVAVGGFTVASSALQSVVALRVLRVGVGAFSRAAVAPIALGLVVGGALRLVELPGPPVARVGLGGGAYVGGYLVLCRLLLPADLARAIGSFGDGRGPKLARRLLHLSV